MIWHRLKGQAASAHNRNEVVKGGWHIYPEKAAAALWTTPTDMAKMTIFVYRCANGFDESTGLSRIIGKNLCQEMLTMHQWPLKDGRTKKMGLGFMVDENNGAKTFHHRGANEGIRCNFRGVISSNDLHGTIIMTNSSRGDYVIDELEKKLMMFMDGTSINRLRKKLLIQASTRSKNELELLILILDSPLRSLSGMAIWLWLM